jgi:hypothetical protein
VHSAPHESSRSTQIFRGADDRGVIKLRIAIDRIASMIELSDLEDRGAELA